MSVINEDIERLTAIDLLQSAGYTTKRFDSCDNFFRRQSHVRRCGSRRQDIGNIVTANESCRTID